MSANSFVFDHIKSCFDHSNIFFLVCIDQQGNYTYLNECFAARYRDVFGDVTGKPAISTIHPDDLPALIEAAGKCRANPEQFASVTLRKKNGHDGYFVTQWDFKLDENTQQIIAMGYDISEFQNKQEHIELLNSTMRDIANIQSHMVRRPFANIMALVNMLEIDENDLENHTILRLLKVSCNELNDEFNKFTVEVPVQEQVNGNNN
ncbi:hypothetical protein GCM10027037_14630 [Mucilaginibacter koreensis]